MENKQKLKQIIQTNKMAFDYNYAMMMSAYEQNKLLFYTYLNQSTDLPPTTREAIEKWLQGYKEGCEHLKKMADDGFKLVEKSMSSSE